MKPKLKYYSALLGSIVLFGGLGLALAQPPARPGESRGRERSEARRDDTEQRLAELERRRDEIEREYARRRAETEREFEQQWEQLEREYDRLGQDPPERDDDRDDDDRDEDDEDDREDDEEEDDDEDDDEEEDDDEDRDDDDDDRDRPGRFNLRPQILELNRIADELLTRGDVRTSERVRAIARELQRMNGDGRPHVPPGPPSPPPGHETELR